jgi:hypothetical protein
MPTPFSSQDLGRIFDARTITRGRSLGLANQVEVQLDADTITAIVQDRGVDQNVRITPSLLGRRVVFDHRCTCRVPGCAHLAAAALAALDHFPSLRKPEQQTFLDLLAAAPEQERQRTVFELAPGQGSHACIVSTFLVGERTSAVASTTPRRIAADEVAEPGQRLSSITPASISGYSAFGQTLVRSNGLCRWVFACASVITWMKRVHRGKSPASIAFKRSRPWLSRSLAMRTAASSSVRFWMPCWVRKWNLTQTRSFAAL